jgi:hypothetical protein
MGKMEAARPRSSPAEGSKKMSLRPWGIPSRMLAIVCAMLLAPGDTLLCAQTGPGRAPIALYPDALLAQIVAASTYPLQIVKANRWLHTNSQWKGKKLVDEADKLAITPR